MQLTLHSEITIGSACYAAPLFITFSDLVGINVDGQGLSADGALVLLLEPLEQAFFVETVLARRFEE